MELDNEKWLINRWQEAQTEQDWRDINRMLHGAGMSVFRFEPLTAMDYWLLADIAGFHTLDSMRTRNERGEG